MKIALLFTTPKKAKDIENIDRHTTIENFRIKKIEEIMSKEEKNESEEKGAKMKTC